MTYQDDVKNNKGTKNDSGKTRLDLITPEFIEELGKVLTLGAKKYADYNWQKNLETNRIYAALLRHANAYHKGEHKDPESGLSHMAHVACNAMFLLWYEQQTDSLNMEKKK